MSLKPSNNSLSSTVNIESPPSQVTDHSWERRKNYVSRGHNAVLNIQVIPTVKKILLYRTGISLSFSWSNTRPWQYHFCNYCSDTPLHHHFAITAVTLQSLSRIIINPLLWPPSLMKRARVKGYHWLIGHSSKMMVNDIMCNPYR